jgi:hypothetical protein
MSLLDINDVNLKEYYTDKIVSFYSKECKDFYSDPHSSIEINSSQLFIHCDLERIIEHPRDFYLMSLNRMNINGSKVITYLRIYHKFDRVTLNDAQKYGWKHILLFGLMGMGRITKLDMDIILNDKKTQS